MNTPIRIHFTGTDEAVTLSNVLAAARAYIDLASGNEVKTKLTLDEIKVSFNFVLQKFRDTIDEWNETLSERSTHSMRPDEELRYFGELSRKAAKKALQDIKDGRAAQARAKRAQQRGDIEERGHFR
jgi:hypothetical protein